MATRGSYLAARAAKDERLCRTALPERVHYSKILPAAEAEIGEMRQMSARMHPHTGLHAGPHAGSIREVCAPHANY